MNKHGFLSWLENRENNWKESTIKRYVNAISTISREFSHNISPGNDLYKTQDVEIIDRILSDQRFKLKDYKGHRMYSSALKYFRMYILEELFKEDALYEQRYHEYTAKHNINLQIIDVEKEKPTPTIVNNQKIWRRNPQYASEAIAAADFLCEFDNKHQHFLSMYSKRNFVEAHHLIPMRYQEIFDCSLDVHANIVSLCVVCHKKVHYCIFEDKKEILDKLFFERETRLQQSGIRITLEKLYSLYNEKSGT